MNIRTRIVTSIVAGTLGALGFVAAGSVHAGSHHAPAKVTHRAPTTQERNELIHATKVSGLTNCHLEWDAPVRDQYEAICSVRHQNLPADCVRVPVADQPACLKLDYRTATMRTNADGSVTETPAGAALISECVSQYKGVELTACLNQPAS